MEKYSFEDFLRIMDRLRGEDGCPWDKVQTHESLRKCMLEEAYEVVDAIDSQDMENLCEELGDVLMQVVFHARLANEKGIFDITDVIDGISRKMIRRHPHIFSDAAVSTPEEVVVRWEDIKKQEKSYESQTEALRAVPKALPALLRAEKVQKKAAEVGFDFPDSGDTLKKLLEEVSEFCEAVTENMGGAFEEFGDILFSLVNVSRFFKINPEFALTKAQEKFINRFEYVEKMAKSQGKSVEELPLSALDAIWEQSKDKGY